MLAMVMPFDAIIDVIEPCHDIEVAEAAF